MKKLIRNSADEQSRAFWDSVRKSADAVRTAPAWMQAGITLNEQNFTTFGPKLTQVSDTPRPPSGQGRK